MTRRRGAVGIVVSAGPRTATTTARSAIAATAPYPADLQSRAVPAARTMVVASTASTAEARNTARNSAPALISNHSLGGRPIRCR